MSPRGRGTISMIFALIATIFFALLRFWADAAIVAHVPAPYGLFVLHAIGVALLVAGAFLLDRLIRALFWNGYLRHRRGQNTPALIEDIVTIALVVLGISLGLYFEEGMSVTGLVTASGATAIILGIALQVVIQDLFSGLSVNLDGSYAIGDWLTFYTDQMPEPLYGCVSGITWRTTFLTLEDGRRLMVPNHMMTSQPVLNHSRPAGPKRYIVEVSADNRIPFKRLNDALLGEAFKVVTKYGFARTPEPSVVFDRLGEDGCYYHVRFYAYPDRISVARCRSIMLTAIQDVVIQNDFASPVQQLEIQPPPNLDFTLGEKETRAILARSPLFADALDEEQIADLAAYCNVVQLERGRVLMKQGDEPGPMFIILEGAISITVANADSQAQEVAVSAAGDVVGEMSLMTGAPRTATATALSSLLLLEITKPGIAALLEKSPHLAVRFSEILSQRQRKLDEVADHAARNATRQKDILARMKDFFAHALGTSS